MKSDVEAVKTRRESTLQPQALPAVIAEADISRPALVLPGFEKENPLTRLADLRPPANLRDPAAFFDCACEVSTYSEFSASARPNSIYLQIVEDVYTNEMRSMTTLYVTDFTSNERFWQNSNHPDYPRARVVLQISIFGNEQRQKVATLHHGDRAILRNIRCKLDKQDNLEGHIGERNVFRVEKLSKEHEAYKQLDARSVSSPALLPRVFLTSPSSILAVSHVWAEASKMRLRQLLRQLLQVSKSCHQPKEARTDHTYARSTAYWSK